MDYELIIIGAGPGGYEAAIRAAQLGLQTAVIEKAEVGGTCLNRGCIPTKSLLHDAGEGKPLADMMARKDSVVASLRSGIELLLNKNKIALIKGEAMVTGPGTVTVNGETLHAAHILIAAGSVPQRPPIPGLDLDGVVTSDELLDAQKAPKTLAIIGGGVIGVEFATLFAAMGTKVVILEAMDRILPLMDREIAQNLGMIFKKQGVAIHTSAKVLKIDNADGLQVVYEEKAEVKSLACDTVLVATGRRPNTQTLFAPGAAPGMQRGFITVNEQFETSVPGVYAVGDAIGGMMLAHQASAQGIACVEKIAGKASGQDLTVIPACVYTAPEIASVGLTPDEAKAQGMEVVTGKYVMGGNCRTVIADGPRGFIKLTARKEDGVLVGAQMMCERATDMIGEITTAIVNGLNYHQLARGIRPHPTFNEGLLEALHDIESRAVHILPKR